MTISTRRTRSHVVICAVLAALPLSASLACAQSITKKDVALLLRMATITEWVTANCGEGFIAELDGMLLLTMPSVIRNVDAGDRDRFRADVKKHVASFSSREATCRSATDYLKSRQ